MLANVFQTAKLNFLNDLSGGGSAVRSKATAGATEIKQKNEGGINMVQRQPKTTYVVKDVFKEPDKKKREQKVFNIVIKHIKAHK